MFEKLFKNNGTGNSIEIYYSSTRSFTIDIARGRIELGKKRESEGYGIRSITKAGEGFSSTTDYRKLNRCAEDAKKLAVVGRANVILPEASAYTEPKGIYDPDIARITPEECVDYAQGMIDSVDPSLAKILEGSFSVSDGSVIIQNSNGLYVEEKGTVTYAFLRVLSGQVSGTAPKPPQPSSPASASTPASPSPTPPSSHASAFSYHMSRNLDFDLSIISREAIELAVKSRDPKKLDSGVYDIIFEPYAINDLFSNLLIPAFDGDWVQRGKSRFSGLLGENVASSVVSIVDNGMLDNGLGSSGSDGEGVPTGRTGLIEKGILEGYLYDMYTAQKENRKSTGNAVRSYHSIPGIGSTNFILSPGRYSREDVIGETKKGLLVTDVIGAHTANVTSGDFAVELDNTFLVENGVVKNCIKKGILTGNIFNLLKNIDLIANNSRQMGSVFTPSFRVCGMNVIS